MAKITSEQQAVQPLPCGIGRSELPRGAQLAHARLVDQQARAETPPPTEPASGYVTVRALGAALIVLGLRATIATFVRIADGIGPVAKRSPPVHSHATP